MIGKFGLMFALVATSVAEASVEIVMDTELGAIHVELYPERAPATVENFLRYLDEGLFDGATFYRVVRLDNQAASDVPIQVVQGGLYGPTMRGETQSPPEVIPPVVHESTADTGLAHVDGAVSMARGEPGTATSEFFISVGDNPALDFGGLRNPDGQGFAVFGQVTQGMEIVRRIQQRPSGAEVSEQMAVVQGQLLETPVKILSVRRTAP